MSPSQRGGIQVGYNMIPQMLQAVPPSPSDPRPPYLEDSTIYTKHSRSSKTITQFYTLPLEILHNIGTWYFSLLHQNKFKKFLMRLEKIIHFFVPPGLINSSISRFNTLHLTKTLVTCEHTGTYHLSQPSLALLLPLRMVVLVLTNKQSNKSNTRLSKVI